MCHHVLIKRRREELSETIGRVMPTPEFFPESYLENFGFSENAFSPSGGAFKNRDEFYISDVKEQAPEARD
jgi:hypothetical protein